MCILQSGKGTTANKTQCRASEHTFKFHTAKTHIQVPHHTIRNASKHHNDRKYTKVLLVLVHFKVSVSARGEDPYQKHNSAIATMPPNVNRATMG